MGAVDSEKAVRVRISGRVQGVGYRDWTVDQAMARDLRGWVRNRIDGSVEALFVGPADQVDDMIAACRRGPRLASVTRLEIEQAQGIVAGGFERKPTV